MPTTVTLRPNATVSSRSVTLSGEATVHEALDASTGSYVDMNDTSPTALVKVDLDDYALPSAYATIRRVRAVVTVTTNGGTQDLHMRVDPNDAAPITSDSHFAAGPYASPTTLYGPWVYGPYSSLPIVVSDWFGVDPDDLVLQLEDKRGGSATARVYEAYVEVDVRDGPTVSGITPTGTGTNAQPVVSWTATPDGGDLTVTGYRLIVYRAATTAAPGFAPIQFFGGFDPAAVWDSGFVLFTTATSRQVGIALPDDDYVFYVACTQSVGGLGLHNGPYATASYTVDRAPNPPEIVFPYTGAQFSAGAGFTADWNYLHPDPARVQTEWALRRKVAPGAYEYWEATGRTWESTEQWNVDGASEFEFESNEWPDGDTYLWSVNTKDPDGDTSGYATDSVLIADSPPVVSITAPDDPAVVSTPTIAWDYSDAESAVQALYQVKLYTADQWSAAGSNPDSTVTPEWTTGQVASTATSVVSGVELENGETYTVAVRAYGGGQWSSWDTVTFDVELDPPGTPTIVVSTDTFGRAKIEFAGHSNVLSFEDSTFETALDTFAAVTNCTVAQTFDQADHGAGSMEMTASATGDMDAGTDTGTDGYPVAASTVYTARASFMSASTGRSCRVLVDWYNSAGTFLSTATGSSSADSSGGFTAVALEATSPSTAAYARVRVEVLAADEIHYVDRVFLGPGTNAQAAWSVGGWDTLTVDVEAQHETAYEMVRGARDLALPTSQKVTVYDVEWIPRQLTTFRARARGYGAQTVTALSATASQTWNPTTWYLCALTDNYETMLPYAVAPEAITMRRPVRSGKFYPKGRDTAVVIGDGRKRGWEFDLPLWITNQTVEAILESVSIDPARTMMLHDPNGAKFYVRMHEEETREFLRGYSSSLPRAHFYKRTLRLVEVERPPS